MFVAYLFGINIDALDSVSCDVLISKQKNNFKAETYQERMFLENDFEVNSQQYLQFLTQTL